MMLVWLLDISALVNVVPEFRIMCQVTYILWFSGFARHQNNIKRILVIEINKYIKFDMMNLNTLMNIQKKTLDFSIKK